MLIVGLAFAAFGAGWMAQVEGIAVAAVVIGAGELAETSVDAWALRRQVATSAKLSRVRSSSTGVD
jgi:hypothetical protein